MEEFDESREYTQYLDEKQERAYSGRYLDIERIREVQAYKYKQPRAINQVPQIHACACSEISRISGCPLIFSTENEVVKVLYFEQRTVGQLTTFWHRKCFEIAIKSSAEAYAKRWQEQIAYKFTSMETQIASWNIPNPLTTASMREDTDGTQMRAINKRFHAYKSQLEKASPDDIKRQVQLYNKLLVIKNEYEEYEPVPITWNQYLASKSSLFEPENLSKAGMLIEEQT